MMRNKKMSQNRGHMNSHKAKVKTKMSVEEEEAKEAPIKGKAVKMKAKTPPTSHSTPKKVAMPMPKKA